MPIYVINLDRRPDRWEAITADLERLGLEATRIPGVEAVELIERDKEAREKGNSPLLSINPGSAACMIGHSEALTRLIESDFPAALILEDDAELASDTPSLLQSTDWWPEGSLLIRLEHGSGKSGSCARYAARRQPDAIFDVWKDGWPALPPILSTAGERPFFSTHSGDRRRRWITRFSTFRFPQRPGACGLHRSYRRWRARDGTTNRILPATDRNEVCRA
ncbi:MAG: glycosyltransferase family 25 protein [Rhodospirillaceae bacterium]|nr:glycosyltransferase family 25 protein [Rhodospirillaceae bacterium]